MVGPFDPGFIDDDGARIVVFKLKLNHNRVFFLFYIFLFFFFFFFALFFLFFYDRVAN